ncbi:alpha/beta-hydrolase [Laetiporus sulphureus 93-53]|uniref:Alpha/beta-hydrolase n=1 Tax=Laetiporus sulphureus 93-53 TaxID=1314785 RepID=A0A165F4D5_9APHY|nr:alpha/beta-hydrolase [Laetiporus sulphureus 93-53]KZT08360.1 alpha/beta-hydrolase [Laetiporus sulphureus 93-53]
MIDHLLGRPNPSWKRIQVVLVIFFWLWRILRGNPGGPRLLWIRRANRALRRFTPWQLVVSTLTGVYAVRNLDRILGLGSPEPLAELYSPAYYRATWISTGLDAGFATAMTIRPKWLRDLCSVMFSLYYIVYANEADEKLRKFRAVPTVEMLRSTWEKTTNPYIRALTYYPKVTIRRKLLLSRPNDSTYTRRVTAWLYFAPPEHQLSRANDLILDVPGGGFISMTPEHHEERLRMWAVHTGKPVLSIDYGKAPEYPYPYAIDECFDVYRILMETGGRVIGMSGHKLNVIISGDSAGAQIATSVMFRILETQLNVPLPLALVLNYPCLDFNFTSWMSPSNLRVLQSEESFGHLAGLAAQKDHYGHISPLSMVGDRRPIRRRKSWRDALRNLASPTSDKKPLPRPRRPSPSVRNGKNAKTDARAANGHSVLGFDEAGEMADVEDDADLTPLKEEDKPILARVRFHPQVDEFILEQQQKEAEAQQVQLPVDKAPIGTRLTMTSRTGYFSDRIIPPSMMRAMAILYIGPYRNPDFSTDYYISPILAPSHLLARLPPILMSCGEKDPFVDDTVIFAGRVREAKWARRAELDAALSGESAKPVEHLLNGTARTLSQEETQRALRRERELLAGQGEEDWVTMRIFSEWSHGYLQMPMLMQEARTAIYDLADWIDEQFGKKELGSATKRDTNGAANGSARGKRISQPARGMRLTIPSRTEDGFTSVTSDTELETETDDALTFSPKKRVTPPLSSDVTGANGKSLSPPRVLAGSLSPPGRGKHSRSESASRRRAGKADDNPSETELPATPRFDLLQDVVGQPIAQGTAGGQKPRQRESSPGFSSRTGTPGKSGQTISESELMRRRRLLDSHLISDPK